MRLLAITLVFCLCKPEAKAQVEWSAGLQSVKAPYWEMLHGNQYPLFQNGYSVGMNIQLPSEDRPIRWAPGMSLHWFNQQLQTDQGEIQTRVRHLGMQIPVRVYLLDLLLDCDCPNYRNGVFLFAGLGASHLTLHYQTPDLNLTDGAFAPYFSLGGGIVLKYSNWFQVVPQFHLRHFPAVQWEGLSMARNNQTNLFFREETFLNQLGFELNFQLFLPEN